MQVVQKNINGSNASNCKVVQLQIDPSITNHASQVLLLVGLSMIICKHKCNT